ncbi:MAG TPA: hypothetical protein VJV75_03170, partial [Candidatus Polarisedimenticolia bacterium]|nr:hypothetical protein [Candidatus Polarisedimenticolia bacterium]
RLVGGRDARPAFGGVGVTRLSGSATVNAAVVTRVGRDWLVEGRLTHARGRANDARAARRAARNGAH